MKRWKLLEQAPEARKELIDNLKLNPVVAQILINRGICSNEQIDKFLNPKLAHLSDPFDIPGIQKAAQRIFEAKEKSQKVLVYGDYDVDGVTGTTVLLETLKHMGIQTTYYIPFRYGEGYSLNMEAIQKIKNEGVNLIVTVDCGISSKKEVELANSLGIDVIITDHHNLPAELPPALAVINPKMIKGDHPTKDLAGVGVAFKFAWGLLRLAGIKDREFLTELLDMVALGTIADIVPLTFENRILTVHGLRYLNNKKRTGIKYLTEAASLVKKLSIRDVNFSLAPRLNAAGRLEHASLSVELLIAREPAKAKNHAKELNLLNEQRQKIGKDIQKDVLAVIAQESDDLQKVIVHSGEGWHPGVIGITAAQIAEKYYRPAILIGINEGIGRGSARSIEGYSIYNLLEANKDLFVEFGGHAAAAGFEIRPENIDELKRRIRNNVQEDITEETFSPIIKIDTVLNPKDISLNLIKELEALEPFGEGNPAPIFMSRGLNIVYSRKVGAVGSHLRLKVSDGKVGLDVIGFGLGKLEDTLSYDKTYDIAYKLETNTWDGFEVAQLNLVDIKETTS